MEQNSQNITINISGTQQHDKQYSMKGVRTVEIAKEFYHLANIPATSYESHRPKLLIGLNYAYLGTGQTIEGGEFYSSATHTKFGWAFFGPTGPNKQTNPQRVLHACECQPNSKT